MVSQEGRIVEPDFLEQHAPPGSFVLPDLSDEDREDVAVQFHDIIAKLSEENGHKTAWWYTWLSCHERTTVRLLDDLCLLKKIQRLLEKTNAPLLTLDGQRFELSCSVEKLVNASGWNAKRQGQWLKRSVGWFQQFRHIITEPIRWKWAAMRTPRRLSDFQKTDVIIVTIMDKAFLKRGVTPFIDLYFGSLASDLIAQGKNVLTLGFTEQLHSELTELTEKSSVPVATLGYFLSFTDIVRAFFRSILFRINTNCLSDDTAALVKSGVGDVHREVMIASCIEFAMARALKMYPQAQVIQMCENNFWERGVNVAAQNASPPRSTVGYLHCAILKAHTKNYIAPVELEIRPRPSVICCTGDTARSAFLEISGFEADRVRATCALRGPPLTSLVLRQNPPAQVKRILVLLEGINTMVAFIRFIDFVAENWAGGPEWIIRCHPNLPVERLREISGVHISNESRLKPSVTESLQGDVALADVVFYQGTTAAILAGYMGVPLLRFDGATLLNDDPLFECDALKAYVRTLDQVQTACTYFAEMKQSHFESEHKAIKLYIENYQAPVDTEALQSFFLQ